MGKKIRRSDNPGAQFIFCSSAEDDFGESSGSERIRRHCFAESRRRGSGHPAEHAGEVALVGEAAFGGDDGEGPLRVAQKFAGGSDLQALLVVAGGTILQLTK